jgi:rSAM/selenodomain-associated transferase 2
MYPRLLPIVSLIVPVRNDTPALKTLLTQLTAEPVDTGELAAYEVIVSYAAPQDDELMRLRARHSNITWVDAPPGRGSQLNSGAALATGTWLWFVHADSRLPSGWLDAFRNLEADPNAVVGGAFRFCLDSPAWQARLLERAVAWRVRWFDLPYGDQGIFVRRDVFTALGGFASIPLMEDVELIRRLKGSGRLRHLRLSLTTSARRWEEEGWWRRSARNLVTLARYGAGVSPEKLASRYYGERIR